MLTSGQTGNRWYECIVPDSDNKSYSLPFFFSENKKKRDVVSKLLERGYPSDPVKIWKESQKKTNVVIEETDDDESRSETSSISSTSSSSSSGPDYGYLLSMAILSLSQEKKDELLKQRDNKVMYEYESKYLEKLYNLDLCSLFYIFYTTHKQGI